MATASVAEGLKMGQPTEIGKVELKTDLPSGQAGCHTIGYCEVCIHSYSLRKTPMETATVAQCLEMGQPTEDGKIDFTTNNFDDLPDGHVISMTFGYKGDSWKLDVRKCGCQQEIVDVIVRLQLVIKTSLNVITARIGCEEDPDEFRYKEEFDEANDFMVAIFTFEEVSPEDNLKLQVQLVYADDNDENEDEVEQSPMSKWFESADFGDMTIVAKDGKKFRCHRDILARRSQVFRQMFNAGMKEPPELFNMEDFDGEVVAQLLLWVYTDNSQVDKIADRLYGAAHLYQLDNLKVDCATALADNLSVDTVVKTYRLANQYHLDDLMAKCVDFLDTNKSVMTLADLLVESMKIGDGNEGEVEQK